MIDNVLSALAGALVAILTGVIIEAWKTEREDFFANCRDFSQLISEAADAGAEFWLSSPSDSRAKFLRARIAGFQSRIGTFNAIMQSRFDDEAASDVQQSLVDLFGTLTGGDPDDPGRVSSMPAAIAVQDAAAHATLSVMRASYGRVSGREWLYRFVGRSRFNRRS